MTKAHHMNEAMQWLKGALNCYAASKIDGQGFIGHYVKPQMRDARRHLFEARKLQGPRLPA